MTVALFGAWVGLGIWCVGLVFWNWSLRRWQRALEKWSKALVAAACTGEGHRSKGQRAVALAMLYPEPGGKGGRGKKDPATDLRQAAGFSIEMLRRARQIVRHPDLAIEVRDGRRSLDGAFREAQDRMRVI